MYAWVSALTGTYKWLNIYFIQVLFYGLEHSCGRKNWKSEHGLTCLWETPGCAVLRNTIESMNCSLIGSFRRAFQVYFHVPAGRYIAV